MKAVLASNNKHKLVEIKTMLSGKFDDILTLKDLNIDIEIEENGSTFEENAYIKASTIAKMTNMCAIADDSGICVLALDGEPNIYSARYAGEPCNDKNNNENSSPSSTLLKRTAHPSTEQHTFKASSYSVSLTEVT